MPAVGVLQALAVLLLMALPQTDTFTGAAGVLGATWTQQRTSGTVNYNGSGSAVASTLDVSVLAFDNSNAYPNDQYSKIHCGVLNAGADYNRVIARSSGVGDANINCYNVSTDGSHVVLSKWVAGVETDLTDYASATVAAGDSLEIRCVGTSITVLLKGVVLGTTVDSTHASGKAGVGLVDSTGGGTASIQDWEGGSLQAVNFYLNNPVQGGSNAGLLDTTAPTASTSTTGWTVGTTAVNQYSRQTYNTEIPTTGFTGTAQPSGTLVNLGEDAWRLSAATSGTFSAGTWYSSVSVIAVSSGGIQQGRARFRLWASSNADGSSARELTQGTMIGSQVTELNTTVAQTSSASTQISAVTLSNEFLFQQVAWETL